MDQRHGIHNSHSGSRGAIEGDGGAVEGNGASRIQRDLHCPRLAEEVQRFRAQFERIVVVVVTGGAGRVRGTRLLARACAKVELKGVVATMK